MLNIYDERGCVTDHKGNKFRSKESMCNAYGVDRFVFHHRLCKDWSVRDSLLGKDTVWDKDVVGDAIQVFGVCYPNNKVIAEEFGFCTALLHDIDEQDYEKFIISRGRYMYEGAVYTYMESVSEACGIYSRTIFKRLKEGWSFYDATHTPLLKILPGKPVIDHLGNEFPTVTDMCISWGINLSAYYNRKRDGWSLERTLTTPVKGHGKVHKNKMELNKERSDNMGLENALGKLANVGVDNGVITPEQMKFANLITTLSNITSNGKLSDDVEANGGFGALYVETFPTIDNILVKYMYKDSGDVALMLKVPWPKSGPCGYRICSIRTEVSTKGTVEGLRLKLVAGDMGYVVVTKLVKGCRVMTEVMNTHVWNGSEYFDNIWLDVNEKGEVVLEDYLRHVHETTVL